MERDYMTMLMHARELASPAYPVAQVIKILSVEVAAKTVGKSETMLRAWADPNRDTWPNLEHQRLLDAACMEAKGRAPFAEWLDGSSVVDLQDTDCDIKDQVIGIAAKWGEVQKRILEVKDPNRPSNNEKDRIYSAYQDFVTETRGMNSTIMKMQLRRLERD
jgi:hypothetical protein